ncbi:16S rRNA (guanine(966)-N(2))-methyltransferase RsmD [Marinitoga hydrogenitolerans DSM 16785]|uniref:16S rRNA (Guanine(966)-N(2))-methyltransferase RsmD n=1 Tax=Marinitoga hydrogenitolerans (strain DSM 16785 / JCM 12826 / AT1271) TaxID=1122195 RepID=A0A1M4SN76_MARH1|nr:16S rRNA (guanine(966)-N(2))-methyltransferase RsmD [Marinitoga hydrogenitolerans]SHE33612.1 16S rRNA (guanine(966)-N(2))-methyltransferase RsmD [Marinitoga hydrogenitolerans DSM 16785]
MLSIENGFLKGRKINIVPDKRTRYTPANVRRALLNIVDVTEMYSLEIFGGSGIVSFEFISSGAENATIVETSKKACSTIIKNAKSLKIDNKINLICSDFRKGIIKLTKKYDIIFMDPPFQLGLASEALKKITENKHIYDENTIIIVEHSKREILEKNYGDLIRNKEYNYGDIKLSVYVKDGE